ncbi:hypothetical protein ACPA2N_25730 [Ectopseudomonas hydrolytica]|uniref:hypothetical protein n=1 Tax=Ectopseudomonas hydrolytica TaxID=2493633 RepID=UPI003C2FEF00
METYHDRARRLARAVAATWMEIDSFLAAAPDMNSDEAQERLFALESAAEQAREDYWENADAEADKG